MILSDTAIKNRTTIGVLMVLMVVAGVYSYIVLPRESAPDIPIPIVLVTTTYEGVSPADVETSVTMKIEQELTGLKGVDEISSTSAEGVSSIIIEFLPDVLIEDALANVRDKVDQAKRELPNEAEDPTIGEVNIAEFPIMIISMSGTISPVRLKDISDRLEDDIEEIPGVLNVDVLGTLEREIRLEIDQDRLVAYGLTIPEILELIPSENVNISAGGLETAGTKFNVRVPAEFIEPDEVAYLIIARREGRPIYLTDVATVKDTFKDRVGYARLDGNESISLSIQKRIGANIIPISDTIKTLVERYQAQVPKGVKLEITLDNSDDIRRMVADLENNILSGLILVVLVLILFMGWRTSLIVALAIPMSMLTSFAILSAIGFTLNMVVLFSLILSLGMLVDNAIVIVENIFRHMQMGYKRIEAAMKGTAEVAWPVITSTTTTVAAFSPMMFWPGLTGDFMKYLPITVIITLTSSLFVAMIISPVVCSVVAGGRIKQANHKHPFINGYRKLLDIALHHKVVTLCSSLLILVAVVITYFRIGRGMEFFPDIDPARAVINIRAPQGTNVRESDRLAKIAEKHVSDYKDDLRHVVTNVGSSGGTENLFIGGGTGGPHMANLTLVFEDFEDRRRPSAEVIAELREDLAYISGAEVNVEKEKHGPPTGAAVSVRIIGEDFKTLEQLSEEAKKRIIGVLGLVNLRSDLEATRPEIIFRVDRRRASLLGVNTRIIGNFLKTSVFGSEVGTYRQFNDEYDITVRLPVEQRQNIEDLFRLRVPNMSGDAIPLSSLGSFDYKGGFGTINRVNQKRVVTLTGDAEGRLSTAVLKEAQTKLAKMDLPAGYRIEYAGEKEEQDKAKLFLFKAFVFAILLIVMILVAQFNTLSVPFIIMTTVILSLIGVFVGLLICDMPFGIIMTGVGVISLAGVVVNNAIVLLDYTRKLQRKGMDIIEAAVKAGTTRLRPVLLTATTTILGLIPMATGVSFNFHTFSLVTRSESSQWWSSMAIAVIFGLGFATMLTLLVVPTLYVVFYKASVHFGLGGLKKSEPEKAQ